jgi:N-sulfoglucosamine sulfohydrolase
MKHADDPRIRARADFYIHRCPQELYDLRTDPDCLHNLLDEPGDRWTPRVRAMRRQLWQWMKATDDPELETFEAQVDLALD